jgi:hypothetical protein
MRKNILKALGLVTILTFTNCSTDNLSNQDIPSAKTSLTTASLKSNLSSFNKNFVYKTKSNVDSKRWWQYVGMAAAIAVGDVGGAATGVAGVQVLAGVVGAATAGTGYAVVSGVAGVVGAVGGSYAGYCGSGGHCRGTFNGTGALGTSVVYDFPDDYDYIENFGVLHNDALQNVYMSDQNVNELTWIGNKIPNVNAIDYNLLYNSPEFKELTGKIAEISNDYKNSGYKVNVLLDGYKTNNMITSNNYDILSLYFDAVLKVQTFEDYKEITDYYVDKLKESDLTGNEKEALYAGFAVSVQSFYYWLNLDVE